VRMNEKYLPRHIDLNSTINSNDLGILLDLRRIVDEFASIHVDEGVVIDKVVKPLSSNQKGSYNVSWSHFFVLVGDDP